MSTTIATLDAILKQVYKAKNFQKTTYTSRPLLGMLPKEEDFGGRNMPLPLLYGNPQGRSANFTNAQANTTSPALEDFLLTRVKDYSIATIEGEAIRATRGDAHSFVKGLKLKVDAAINSLADAHESFMFRSGTGSLGRVGSGETTKTITLKDINDIPNFEVGMTVVVSAADGGSIRTGTEVIEAVNRITGTLDATSATWDAVITAIAADDYIYVQGDAANGGANVKVSGLLAWCPASDPAATAFFGVDRTVDNRLFGMRHDGSSQLVEEALIDGASKSAREGGEPDYCFMNHAQVRKLIKELGSKKEYSEVNAQNKKGTIASIGYRAVVIQGDHGFINVVAANKCQSNIAWMLTMRTWMLASIGPAVGFLDEDGQKFLRQASADGYETRIGFYGQLGCNAPIWSTNITLAAA
jgi:hypothetical protein